VINQSPILPNPAIKKYQLLAKFFRRMKCGLCMAPRKNNTATFLAAIFLYPFISYFQDHAKILLRSNNQMNLFKTTLSVIATCTLFSYPPSSPAQPPENTPSIKLLSRTIVPNAGVVEKAQAFNSFDLTASRNHLLIQFYQLPDASERVELAAAGVELLDYVPDNAWFAATRRRSSRRRARRLAGSGPCRWRSSVASRPGRGR
jgi:hypothetical protein